ncbi:unnamed protein product [Closterium sp. Naga37s-1]|nr:unnamed protein product [Closterium sp. Naga37s-1]
MRVPACPSVPEPSLAAPPLLRRSQTEGTHETEPLDYSITLNDDFAALHLDGAMTHGAAPPHPARQGSNEALQDSGRASRAASQGPFKNPGRRRTLRGDSCGSLSEGCIPIVPDPVGSLVTVRPKGSAPHFVPASEHRLFSGLDNGPRRFHRSSMSFSQLQDLSAEMSAQPEAAQKLPMQKLPAQQLQTQERTTQQLPAQQLPALQLPAQQLPTRQLPTQQLPTQQLPTQQLPTQQLPTQQLPVQKLAAAAEIAGAGKGTAHAASASECACAV